MWGRKKKAKEVVDESLDDIEFEGVEVEDANVAGEIAVESIIASHIDFNLPYLARCDCSVCITPYAVPTSATSAQSPKLLSCLHTFCSKCILTKMIRYNKNARNSLIICSICQAETLFQSNGMPTITSINELLPDDVTVIHAMELFADNKTTDLVDEYRKHEYTCGKCNKFGNIPKAYSSHDSSPSVKNKSLKQQLSPTASTETTDLNYDDMTKCIDCDTIVCLKCAIFGTCRGHNMKQIHDLARENRQDLNFVLKDTHKNIASLVSSMDNINDLMQNADYRTKNVRSHIKAFFDELRAALDSQEKKFMNAIDSYCEVDMQEFGKEKLAFTEQILITSSAYKWAKFIHEKSSDVQYIRLHDIMKQRLAALNKIQMKVKGVTPTFSFSTDANAVRNFAKYITDIGKTCPNDGRSKNIVENDEDMDSEDDLDIFKDTSNVEIISNSSNPVKVNANVAQKGLNSNENFIFSPLFVTLMILLLVGIQVAHLLHERKLIELDSNCAMIMPIATYVGAFYALIVAIKKTLQK